MEPEPFGHGWRLKPGAASAIRREVGVRAFVLRRSDVRLRENKIRETRVVEWPREARAIYDALERDFEFPAGTFPQEAEAAGAGRTAWSAALWGWLRQTCSGVVSVPLRAGGGSAEIHAAKVRELVDLVTGELAGEPVVVWCHYRGELGLVLRSLRAAGVAALTWDGDTPLAERERLRQAWIAGRRGRVLAIMGQTASVGLDLAHADTCVFFSEPGGLLERLQEEDRILTVDKARDGVPLLYVTLAMVDSVDTDTRDSMESKATGAAVSLEWAVRSGVERRRAKFSGKAVDNNVIP